jgi:alkylated DNA repair protein (DNA oxidative demethylase)
MQRELFESSPELTRRELAPGAVEEVAAAAPFRRMATPGGRRMSVAMTNCGSRGWVTDARGYRYQPDDPDNGHPWPPMPASFVHFAARAATAAGYPDFTPDACLVNRYEPGARMTLHQDVNEQDFAQPIVSVSLGLPATFLFGGPERGDKTQRVPLQHGDVVVWGGPSRRWFHGVLPVRDGVHPLFGRCRVNLTLRCAR